MPLKSTAIHYSKQDSWNLLTIPWLLHQSHQIPYIQKFVRHVITDKKCQSDFVKSETADWCYHLVNIKSSFFSSRKQFHILAGSWAPFSGGSGTTSDTRSAEPHKCTVQTASESVQWFKPNTSMCVK